MNRDRDKRITERFRSDNPAIAELYTTLQQKRRTTSKTMNTLVLNALQVAFGWENHSEQRLRAIVCEEVRAAMQDWAPRHSPAWLKKSAPPQLTTIPTSTPSLRRSTSPSERGVVTLASTADFPVFDAALTYQKEDGGEAPWIRRKGPICRNPSGNPRRSVEAKAEEGDLFD